MQMQVQHRQCLVPGAHSPRGPVNQRQAPAAARSAVCPTSSSKCPGSASARPLATRAVAEAEVVTPEVLPAEPEGAAPGQPGLEIKVKREDLDGGRVRLAVTVPQSTVAHYWERAVNESQAARQPALPPKKQARKGRIVGKEEIKAAVVERLGDLAMREAWQAAGLAQRLVDESIEYGTVSEFDPDTDFTFSVEADVVPEVRWKQHYSKLQIELVEPQAEQVPQLVEAQLQAQLRQTGALRMVQGRGFQQGDVAVVDFSAKNAEGQNIPGLNRPRMRIDSSEPEQLPGLVAGISGLQPGQQREFQVPAPASTPGAEQGNLTCQVSMSELLVTEPAELNDDWVTQHFPTMGNVQELRENLLQGAQIGHVEQADHVNERAITSAVAANVEVDIPENLIVENARRRFEEQLASLAEKVPPEQMKQIAAEQAFVAYVKQRRPEIEETLRAVFGLADVAQQERLTIEQEDVEQALQQALSEGMKDSEELRGNLAQALLDQRALSWMAENADITRVPMEA